SDVTGTTPAGSTGSGAARTRLTAARAAPLPVLPAGVVPVTSEVGRVLRDDDGVAGAWFDGLVAARADVAAACLVRLDPADLEVVVLGRRYSSTSSIRVPNADL